MLKITNLWIRVNTDSSPTDFWYIDYEKGLATRSLEKPKNESIKKCHGSVTEFFQKRGIEIIKETNDEVTFKAETK